MRKSRGRGRMTLYRPKGNVGKFSTCTKGKITAKAVRSSARLKEARERVAQLNALAFRMTRPTRKPRHIPRKESTIKTEIEIDQTHFNYNIRINGISSILTTLNDSNEMLRKILLDECDVILECRTCRNMFRSLSKYISHKSIYCKTTYPLLCTEGFTQLIQRRSMTSSFEINHHIHNTLADKYQQSRSIYNMKAYRLKKVISKIVSLRKTATMGK